jgi:hypothetical protein
MHTRRPGDGVLSAQLMQSFTVAVSQKVDVMTNVAVR